MSFTTYGAYSYTINKLVTEAIKNTGNNSLGGLLADNSTLIDNLHVAWVKSLNPDYNVAYEFFNYATKENRQKGDKGLIITIEETALTRNHIKIIYNGRNKPSTANIQIGGTTDVISMNTWATVIRENIVNILADINNVGSDANIISYDVKMT